MGRYPEKEFQVKTPSKMKKYKFERKYKRNKFKPYTVETNNKYKIMEAFLETQECNARDLKNVQYIITIQK